MVAQGKQQQKNGQAPDKPSIHAVNIRDIELDFSVRQVQTDLWSRIQLWHGEPKIGKTVQANNVPGGTFFLKFEPGHDHISHRGHDCLSWLNFLEAGRALYMAKKRFAAEGKNLPFKTIIVDTASEAFRRCQEFVLREMNLSHESEASFGKGYQAVENEFRRRMTGLCQIGFGVIMIAHTAQVTLSNNKQGSARREWTKLVVDLPKAAERVIPPMCDLILYFCREEVNGRFQRVIKTQGDGLLQAGIRYPNDWEKPIPATLPMDFNSLVDAWDAGNPQADKAEKREPTAPPPDGYDEPAPAPEHDDTFSLPGDNPSDFDEVPAMGASLDRRAPAGGEG